MASTGNLQATVNWSLPHLRYQPLMIGGQEPALSYANMVLQTILGPPFKWRWNRAVASFVCVAGFQDYLVTVADFGFMESATVTDPISAKPWEIALQNRLERDASNARPAHLAAQLDNGVGGITFRLSPAPDKAYTAIVTYQKKALAMTSLASGWGPIPDELAYIYQWGFLSLASLLTNDERFQVFNARFIAHLLGAQGGLDEMERNIFLANWLQVTSQAQSSQLGVTQRMQARAQ